MSQYLAKDGIANDWHFAHLTRFALGKAGLIFTEATAVEERGRRTHGDLGLWNDLQIQPLKRINDFIKSQGSVTGMQLAHAGRKASERRPWDGETPVNSDDIKLRNEHAWQTVAPGRQPYANDWHIPNAMSLEDIELFKSNFKEATKRAVLAGFDIIEVYAAHGFLLHQFYSPLSNTRTDKYGGCFENRIRLCLEVADCIREVWPKD